MAHALRTLPLLLPLFACSSGSSEPEATQAPQDVPVPDPGPVPAFDGDRAWRELADLAALGPRHPGSEAMELQLQWLERELSAIGLSPVREAFDAAVPVTDATPEGRLSFTNLYADLAASVPGVGGAPMVILATHIDTKFLGPEFLGVNDGGSSTVAVLELARGLVAGGPRPVAYRFLFLDGEEAVRFQWEGEDNTYGSRQHAKTLLKTGLNQRVGAFVLLDLIADEELVLNFDTNSTGWLRDLFFETAQDLGLHDHVEGRRSGSPIKDDHLPFQRIGLPVVDLIDLDYGGPSRPHWHTDGDTLEHCSQASLELVARIVANGLPRLEARLLRP